MNHRQRILIADDDPSIRHALHLKFSKAGLEVAVAADGEEGLRLALETEPELLIVDYCMPYLNGYDLCRQLRRHERFNDTPVIVLTAMEQEMESDLAEELGVAKFMTKPFSPRELLAAALELLERSPGSPTEGIGA